MPRVELLMCLIAGLSGGLIGVLWDGMVSSPLLARQGRGHPAYRAAGAAAQFGSALLLAAGGTALGFLFWLGWGLISLVNAPWYLTGLLFGLLTWGGIAVPLLGGLALRMKDFGRTSVVLALEWLVTCLAIGIFCALAWHRYA